MMLMCNPCKYVIVIAYRTMLTSGMTDTIFSRYGPNEPQLIFSKETVLSILKVSNYYSLLTGQSNKAGLFEY